MAQNTAQLLNFVLGIKQLHEQEAQDAYQHQKDTGQAIQSFIQDLSHVKSPSGLVALKKHYNENFHVAGGVLDEMANQYAPSKEEMQRNTAAEGLQRARMGSAAPQVPPELAQLLQASAAQNIAGMSPGAVAQSSASAGMVNDAAGAPGGFSNAMRQGFLNQLFRGQNSGQAAVSDATAALPQADIRQGAMIGLDLIPGAGNKLSATTQMSGQNLAHAAAMAAVAQQRSEMIQKYGLDTTNLAIERAKAQAAIQKGSALTPGEEIEVEKALLQAMDHPGTTEGAQRLAPPLLNKMLDQLGLPKKAGPDNVDVPWSINK